MSVLSKFSKWYYDAPVEGDVRGASAKTTTYAGHGDFYNTKHVDPSLLVPGQSYIYFDVVNPMAPASAVGPFGISAGHRASGWKKVVDVHKQERGPATGGHAVEVELQNGGTATIDITNIKKCIPKPLDSIEVNRHGLDCS